MIIPPDPSNFHPSLTIFLPTRNESSKIQRKIDEVLGMDYPKEKLSILIIDSGSTDKTSEIAKNHLNKSTNNVKWEVVSINTIGKSPAVNHALSLIETDFFVMMDADAICKPISLKLLMEWFEDDKIGAVCGMHQTKPENNDFQYRSRFNITRLGESYFDSTPIFEGSICAFRKKSLLGQGIREDINADDSQLAMLSRSNGFKSVMDSRVQFYEENKTISRTRRLRRAQGIIRALYANKRLLFGEGRYSSIMANTMYFHTFFPWILIASLMLIASSSFAIFTTSKDPSLQELAPFLVMALISVSGIMRSIIDGCLILLEAQIKFLTGNSLNKWNPERD